METGYEDIGENLMRQFSKINASELTTMHCGGKIAQLFEPDSHEQLRELIERFDDFIILGWGSNTIFEDTLITRPVIRLGKGFAQISKKEDLIYAGAALGTKKLLTYCLENALTGIEFMAGIPGTIGGALYMNAGTPDMGIMDTISKVEIMNKDGIFTLEKCDIHYGYRQGGIPLGAVITGAYFSLKNISPEHVRDAIASFIKKKRLQPGGYNSGSMFRNPPQGPAGLLIEQAGMKGYTIGGAKVSEIHANFIINNGNASTSDVKNLISLIKQRVREKFGIELIEEVRIIG
jgi:UDP-N-acetylmuramate dehydrogenase